MKIDFEKFTGRYFLIFIGVFIILSGMLAIGKLSEPSYVSIMNTLIVSFFGGGAIKSIAEKIGGNNEIH